MHHFFKQMPNLLSIKITTCTQNALERSTNHPIYPLYLTQDESLISVCIRGASCMGSVIGWLKSFSHHRAFSTLGCTAGLDTFKCITPPRVSHAPMLAFLNYITRVSASLNFPAGQVWMRM